MYRHSFFLATISTLILLGGCGGGGGDNGDEERAKPPVKINKAPFFVSQCPPVTIHVGENYTCDLTATDPDGDNLQFMAVNPLPAWLRLNSNIGLLSGIPGSADQGRNTITIGVSDGVNDMVGGTPFKLEVTENEPPPDDPPPEDPPPVDPPPEDPPPSEDVTPPSSPTGMKATAINANQVELAWNAATDDVAVDYYVVYRDGVNTGASMTTSLTNAGLLPEVTYVYEVSAVDTSGNEGPKSSPPLNVTTDVCSTCATGNAFNLFDEYSANETHYNYAARLPWNKNLGDYVGVALDSVSIGDAAEGTWVEWDVTSLVADWIRGDKQNEGFLLHALDGTRFVEFASRETANKPQLVVDGQTSTAVGDTYLVPNTISGQGRLNAVKLSPVWTALIRFDIQNDTVPNNARLRLYVSKVWSGDDLTVAVRRLHVAKNDETVFHGIAANYPNDQGIASNPDVFLYENFETDDWTDKWTMEESNLSYAVPVSSDISRNQFEPLQGRALKAEVRKGELLGLHLKYIFETELGERLDEVYMRYYGRFSYGWDTRIQGGKLPGLSGSMAGTELVGGNGGGGGNGCSGFSGRGEFLERLPAGNHLADTLPIGTYAYHVDRISPPTGDSFHWNRTHRAFVEQHRWYSIETYMRVNDLGQKNGVVRAWVDGVLVLDNTSFDFRHIEDVTLWDIWFNFYHGGITPAIDDIVMYVDNIVGSRNYIGPMMNSQEGSPLPNMVRIPDQSASDGTQFALDAAAFFSNPGGSLHYSLSGAPEGLAIDADTGLISGVPSVAAPGRYPMLITASDGVQGVMATVNLSVGSINSGPVRTNNVPDLNITTGQPVQINLNPYFTTDSGADLKWHVCGQPFPWGTEIDNNGLYYGFLPPGIYDVTVAAGDGRAYALDTFSVTVSN